ncbi:MAG: hypothetical protein EBY22_12255 [Gammaproteobacteria bacterium]|jgi:hypothetical protein|nr:hypothetical protein [Gammaproteobacteria bacterium]
MPNKYPEKKGWKVPKQKFKVTNWSEYNESLRRRGNITVWLFYEAISQWYETDRAGLTQNSDLFVGFSFLIRSFS